MAITDESNGFYMPVAPAYNGGNNGFGGFGGDGWWLILLFLLVGGNGWGNGFGGGFDGGLYPWMNNSQNINSGFRDQMLNTQISSIGDKITSGFGDVQTALCGGFAGVNATITNAQMADMNRSFALQSQLADCCCANREATADLKYTLASEACATRAANTQNTQAILDKLCALELDGVKAQVAAEQRENANLRSELMYARGQASQIEQTAALKAGQAAEVDALYNRLSNCPVPTTPVYGRTPIFTCNNGCGCGA